jgi:hypothetical protein
MSSSDQPEIREITDVKMYNPEQDETDPLKKIDFEGATDIFEHEDIIERRRNGWVITGFEAQVAFRDLIYEVTIAGNSMMGYVTVDGIKNPSDGDVLLEIMRDAFAEHISYT